MSILLKKEYKIYQKIEYKNIKIKKKNEIALGLIMRYEFNINIEIHKHHNT